MAEEKLTLLTWSNSFEVALWEAATVAEKAIEQWRAREHQTPQRVTRFTVEVADALDQGSPYCSRLCFFFEYPDRALIASVLRGFGVHGA